MLIRKKTSRSRPSGFSLLELLLVLSLAPIVFFAVYSNFSAGIRIWQRLQVETPEEDMVIFFFKAQKDLLNAMRFESLPFAGEKEQMMFTAGVDAPRELGGDRGIGRVRYYYDAAAHGVMREVQDYSEVDREKPGRIERALSKVRSFELSYLVYSTMDSEYAWRDSFEPPSGKPSSLPVAVKLACSMEGTAAGAERILFLPAGGEIA